VQRRGGTVAFQTALTGGWAGLVSRVGREALAGLDALYLPVSGSNAEVDIRAALSALDRAAVPLTVLGDAEWHNRAAARALGPAFRVTYTNDFAFDTAQPDVQRFLDAYQAATGDDLVTASFTTQRLAATGYSLGRLLGQRLQRGDLARSLASGGVFDGVGVRFDFGGGQVNRALFIQQYTPDGIRRLQ
jgi:branched-chain amino acid transport system substrate-binding protein